MRKVPFGRAGVLHRLRAHVFCAQRLHELQRERARLEETKAQGGGVYGCVNIGGQSNHEDPHRVGSEGYTALFEPDSGLADLKFAQWFPFPLR